MKILVGGCSLSAGFGLPDGKSDKHCWPNLLADCLDADLVNVAIPGYDNQGIFLKILQECVQSHYDLILFQVTGLSRMVVSPNIHGIISLNCTPGDCAEQQWSQWFKRCDYEDFVRMYTVLNGDYEHWNRLVSMIVIIQRMIHDGYNIKFMNGLMHWTEDFFTNQRSQFSDQICNVDALPDEDIQLAINHINHTKKQIDLSHWINPFQSFRHLQIDNASDTDLHPGAQSQQVYCDLVLKFLNH